MRINENLSAALEYAERGWKVFPLHSAGVREGTPRITEWPTRASSDATQIGRWWERWPTAWIGIAAGPESRLVVVDLDVKNDKDGVAEWEAITPDDEGTECVARTPRGGIHLYYATDHPYHNSVSKLAPGIDVRGKGGYVVAPPSKGREWIAGLKAPGAVPGWLDTLLRPETTPGKTASSGSHLADLLVNPPGANDIGWNDWLTKVAGHYAKLIPFEDAFRTLVDNAAGTCDGTWETGEVEKVATSVWSREESKSVDPVTGAEIPKGGNDELERLRAREWAKQQHRIESFGKYGATPPLVTWADEVEIDEPEMPWTIDGLHVKGGNSLLAAQYKTGKTTFCVNLARALIDGEPFLGKYDVEFDDGALVYANYELSSRQFREWLRRLGCTNTKRALIWNLRGFHLPFWEPQTKDLIVRTLADANCKALILDPWAKVFNGAGDENSNSDVGMALDTWDEIKRLADIPDLFLVAHTGRKEFEDTSSIHARAATRLDDWPDARWVLSRDAEGQRWFRAEGRDVDEPEHLLQWNKDEWRYTAKQVTRKEQKEEDQSGVVVRNVTARPGITRSLLAATFKGNNGAKNDLIDQLVEDGRIEERPGDRANSKTYWPATA